MDTTMIVIITVLVLGISLSIGVAIYMFSKDKPDPSAATTKPPPAFQPAPKPQDSTTQPAPKPQDSTTQPAPKPEDSTTQPAPKPQDSTSQPAPKPQDSTSQPAPKPEDLSSNVNQLDTIPLPQNETRMKIVEGVYMPSAGDGIVILETRVPEITAIYPLYVMNMYIVEKSGRFSLQRYEGTRNTYIADVTYSNQQITMTRVNGGETKTYTFQKSIKDLTNTESEMLGRERVFLNSDENMNILLQMKKNSVEGNISQPNPEDQLPRNETPMKIVEGVYMPSAGDGIVILETRVPEITAIYPLYVMNMYIVEKSGRFSLQRYEGTRNTYIADVTYSNQQITMTRVNGGETKIYTFKTSIKDLTNTESEMIGRERVVLNSDENMNILSQMQRNSAEGNI